MSDGPMLCVYCRARPAPAIWRPFCSQRCRQADLGRWLIGSYRVPGPPADGPADSGGDDTARESSEP